MGASLIGRVVAGLPRYRVPQHWGRQLGGTLGEQLAHLHMVLSDQYQALKAARNSEPVQAVMRHVRKYREMTVVQLGPLMRCSKSSARVYLERAVGVGLLEKQDRRDERGNRTVVYVEVQA